MSSFGILLQCVHFLLFSGLGYGALLITRPGSSFEDCERVCREEAEIDCRYYSYSSEKGICTLTAEPDSSIRGLRALGPEKRTAASWVSQFQARILALEQRDRDTKKLKREIAELRAELAVLKNGRVLTHHLMRTTKEQTDQNLAAIDDKVGIVQGDIRRVEDTVITLGDMQKGFAKRMQQLSEDTKAARMTATMLSQVSKDTRGNLREVEASITEFRNSVSDLKKGITDLQVRFAGLSTDVMEKVANVDAMVGPELKEMKFSQTTLAQALGLLTKKIMLISPRIPEIQKHLSAEEAKFSVFDMHMQGIERQISFLTERMSFSEDMMKKIVDPASKMNLRRRQVMARLQSQVETVATTQTRMQNDLIAEISDRSRIYKVLISLKRGRKGIVDQIVKLDQQIKDVLKQVKPLLKQSSNKVVAKILSRQLAALKSLKLLRSDQNKMRTALVKYKTKVDIAHTDLLKQIKDRRATDLALKKLQNSLTALYRRIQATLANDPKNKIIKKLVDVSKKTVNKIKSIETASKETIKKITGLEKSQRLVSQKLSQYFKLVIFSRKAISMQIKQQHQLRQQQEKLKKQFEQQQKVVKKEQKNYVTKMSALEKKTSKMYRLMIVEKLKKKGDKAKITAVMKNLTKKQREIADILSRYSDNLKKIRSDLSTLKTKQLRDSWRSEALHKQLQKLHRAIAILIGHQVLRKNVLGDIRKALLQEMKRHRALLQKEMRSDRSDKGL